MNTMPNPTIVKVSQTMDIEYSDKSVNATVYDLWDTAQQAQNEGKFVTHLRYLIG